MKFDPPYLSNEPQPESFSSLRSHYKTLFDIQLFKKILGSKTGEFFSYSFLLSKILSIF